MNRVRDFSMVSDLIFTLERTGLVLHPAREVGREPTRGD
jgi:hypothetical protein